MPYYRVTPDARLRNYVDGISVQVCAESRPDWPATTILPLGRVQMIFNFADPLLRVDGGVEAEVPAQHFMAQRCEPVSVRASGRTGLIIVVFHYWVSQLICRERFDHSDGQFVNLSDMHASVRYEPVGDMADDATSMSQRLQCVQDFVASIVPGSERDALADAAACTIVQRDGITRIEHLARDFGVSCRHLSRRYKSAVGLSPKKHVSIVRARKAVGLLQAGIDKHQIIEQCGYYDQPHLIHEIGEYCGHTPDAIRRKPVTPLVRSNNMDAKGRPGHAVYI